MPHRLFIGIRPPKEIRHRLIDLMEGLDVRWQEDDQLHLTLRYIGEVDTVMAEDLAERLANTGMDPFTIHLQDTGVFRKKGRAHTLWVGVQPNADLEALQRRIERTCVRAGLPPETRKFHPHITIARMNSASDGVEPFLARTAGMGLGQWEARSYILYESHLRPGGSIYERKVTYPIEP